eukprot:TRINITY_DN111027_c0_g1_i1.p1 TRINITY_DN111027_c0_g1~~TRINITY_DN111027_c0_g1_i1.p1  ORF type:complete len:675 (+),score=69.96 TRINITY_DN111027_c0_g1_i1:50-2074(+)
MFTAFVLAPSQMLKYVAVTALLCSTCANAGSSDGQEGVFKITYDNETGKMSFQTQGVSADHMYSRVMDMVVSAVMKDNPLGAILSSEDVVARFQTDPGSFIDLIAANENWQGSLLPEIRRTWPGAQAIWEAALVLRDQVIVDAPNAQPGLVLLSYLGWFVLGLLYDFRWKPKQYGAVDASQGSSRVKAWDIMKFLILVCVMIEHFWEQLFPKLLAKEVESHDLSKSASMYWFEIFMMSGFTFISGVFGRSFTFDSVFNTFLYTLGGNVFLAPVTMIAWALIFGTNFVTSFWTTLWNWESHRWYLWALLGWRLTITPLHNGLSRLQAPPYVALLIVFILSYCGCHATVMLFSPNDCALEQVQPNSCALEHTHGLGSMESVMCDSILPPGQVLDGAFRQALNKGAGRFLWLNFWYYAPFYAIGLLQPPKWWSEILQDVKVRSACAAFFVLWYVVHAMSEALRNWNSTACFFSDECLYCMPFPPQVVYSSLDIGNVLWFATEIAQKFAMTFAACGVMTWFSLILETYSPWLADLMADFGTRSLYVYVLHTEVLQFAILCGVYTFTDKLPQAVQLWAVWPLAFHMYFMLATRFTETVFQPIVYPVWIKTLLQPLLGKAETPAKGPGPVPGTLEEKVPLTAESQEERPEPARMGGILCCGRRSNGMAVRPSEAAKPLPP